MIKNRKAKIAALAVGMTLALGGAASTASAQTVAELQAQINALMAQLAALQGGSSPAMTFTQNLTLGSTGAEVSALQQALVTGGHLVMPAGVAYGYFGPLTQAAVAKWQAANGVSPAAGYWGPISRARYAALAGPSMPGPSTPGVGITTPGVEGTLSTTLYAVPGAGETVREGADKKAVMGIEFEAKLSDVRIERIKVKLDAASAGNTDRDLYREIADMIYVMDGSNVVGSSALNSSTVVEETSGNYYITITGLNVVIPKDKKKVLTLAVDSMSNFDSGFTGDSWTLTIPIGGVRGVDGAGINLYAPSGALARSFTTQPSLSDSASLALSLSASSPDAREVVASSGADEDEADGVELLRFDARAEDDSVTITDLIATIVASGSTAVPATAYLYDGSSVVGSASISASSTGYAATFDDIDVDIAEDSTKTLSLRIDIDDATSAATTFTASTSASFLRTVAENSEGDDVTPTGSATSESVTVRNVGVEWTLVSKSISKSVSPEQNNISTSSAEATFVVRARAVGGDIMFGDNASTTYPFVTNALLTQSFDVYAGGALTALVAASSTAITVPSSGVVTSGLTNSFTLQENNSADIPVSFTLYGRTTAGGLITSNSYAVGLERLNWVSSAGQQSSTFMNAETSWRTSTVTLP